MSELSRDALLGDRARRWDRHDPVPDGLVARMQAAAAIAASDLDVELMELVERRPSWPARAAPRRTRSASCTATPTCCCGSPSTATARGSTAGSCPPSR